MRTDLAHRFERYKTGETMLSSLKEIRNARQKSLVAARQKLEGMLASKRQLQVEVENLEARVQMIAAAKSTSNYQFDDSRLGRVKELVAKSAQPAGKWPKSWSMPRSITTMRSRWTRPRPRTSSSK